MITERMIRLQEIRDPAGAAARSVLDRVQTIKGEKGEKGDTPQKYVDYFTAAEVEQIVQHIRSMVKDGEKGEKGDSIKGDKGDTPLLGVHYWTELDKKQMAKEASKLVKVPKAPTVEDIIAKIPVPEKEPLTWNTITDAPELTDLNGLIAFLKRGGFRGGGSSAVATPGLSYLPLVTGTIDDTNRIFTFAKTPTIVVVNGASYINGFGVTIAGITATLDSAAGTGGSLYALG